MRTIEVDFSDIARGGKIKVWRDDARGIAVNFERVMLVETAEGMAREAVVTDVEDEWVYFELTPRPLVEALVAPGILVDNVPPYWWLRSKESQNVGAKSEQLQNA